MVTAVTTYRDAFKRLAAVPLALGKGGCRLIVLAGGWAGTTHEAAVSETLQLWTASLVNRAGDLPSPTFRIHHGASHCGTRVGLVSNTAVCGTAVIGSQ